MKKKIFKRLETLYLLIIALGVLIIAPTHLFPQPNFMYARFPHYLKKMGPFFGLKWPATFEIYHYILYVFIATVSINVFGIVFYPKIKKLTVFSSIIGMFLFFLTTVFFFFKLITINFLTAIIYGLYSLILFIANILTFKVLSKK